MTSRARIAASRARIGCPALLAVALLGPVAALSVGGCIESVARTGSPGPGSTAPATATATPEPTGPAPIPSFVRPTPTPLPTFFAYVVKSGDNLNTIAHRYGTTGRSIAYWNRGTYPSLDPEAPGYKPNLVRIGWTLVLIPNVVVDEQTLPEPTPEPTNPFDADPMPS